MSWHMPSRSNKLLFWSLIALAVAMVFAVALALRGFNREGGKNGVTPSVSPDSGEEMKSVPLSEVMTEPILMGWNKDENGLVSVTGVVASVSPVPEQKDVKGTRITLLVSPVVGADIFPAPDKSYEFSLSERDTEGFSEGIKVGEALVVWAIADPSEEYSTIVKRIQQLEKRN